MLCFVTAGMSVMIMSFMYFISGAVVTLCLTLDDHVCASTQKHVRHQMLIYVRDVLIFVVQIYRVNCFLVTWL
jgi:uncharacterized membrane protein affecting hemolysin expression